MTATPPTPGAGLRETTREMVCGEFDKWTARHGPHSYRSVGFIDQLTDAILALTPGYTEGQVEEAARALVAVAFQSDAVAERHNHWISKHGKGPEALKAMQDACWRNRVSDARAALSVIALPHTEGGWEPVSRYRLARFIALTPEAVRNDAEAMADALNAAFGLDGSAAPVPSPEGGEG